MFCHFWQKFENSKWPPFLGEGKILGKLQRLHSLDTLWVENFDEIALSRTVKEIEANLCFAIFGKNSKIQNGRHFWGRGKFWENCTGYLRNAIFAIFPKFSPPPKMAAILNFRIFAKNGKTLICFYLLNRAR